MTAVTQWFSVREKPFHIGLYELGYINHKGKVDLFPFPMHHWDGRQVSCRAGKFKGARRNIDTVYGSNVVWRGLAEEPK